MARRRLLALVALALAAGLLALALRPEAPPRETGGWLAEAGLTPRVATVDGVRVRFVRAGSGPAVVLLHGFASSIVTWREVMPPLARDHDVVALDLPGFGGSDQPPDLSFRDYPRIVRGLMDALGLPRASLVGNSMGGAAAALLAAESPDRVSRLVLIDPAGFHLRPEDRPFLLRLAGSPAVADVLARLPVRRLLVRAALRQVYFDDARVTPELVEEYAVPLFRPGALASMRSLLATRAADAAAFPALVSHVTAPTLVLWGKEDAWIPPSDADRFTAAIPGARKAIIDACGHMPQEERPAETVRLVEGFLGE